MPRRVLLLDTPAGDLREVATTFREASGGNCDVSVETAGTAVLDRLAARENFDLVVVDWFLGDGKRDGAALLAEMRAVDPEQPIVAVAEKGDVDSAAEAVRAGAADFLVRGPRLPERVSTLLGKIRKLFRLLEKNRMLDARVAGLREADRRLYRMVGISPQFHALEEKIAQVARIPRPVLVLGERGTGKELAARAIHDAAGPPDRPIVTVNCAAFPEALLENELFGHDRGAFTGAEKGAPGKFEQARGGTLFLDEIGHMGLAFQQKILRVVEYGRFTRVGGTREILTDARIIAATNAELDELIRDGRFLPDLRDRLAFETIRIAPLRERPADVEVLALHFLSEFAAEIPAYRGKHLSPKAIEALRAYPFPGNVRELKNIIERAAYRESRGEIRPEDLGLTATPPEESQGGTFTERVEALKRRLIEDALEATGGNQAMAARSLGLTYDQFRHQLRKLRSAASPA